MFAYKNPFEFGKLTDWNIESADTIDFQVLDTQTQDFSNPIVYHNLSNPITLTYVNKNVKTNYQFRNSQTSIFYDGRLLKTANVDLTKLQCGISFRILLTTLAGEKYQCNIHIPIPFKTSSSTILEGNLLQTLSTQGSYKFYQF